MCPFKECGQLYTRLYQAKTHVLKILGSGGDSFHQAHDPLVAELKNSGWLSIKRRNITEAERSIRKRGSSSKWRHKNGAQVLALREKRKIESRRAPKIAKRAAALALQYRRKSQQNYRDSRSYIYQRLYKDTTLFGGDNPLTLLDDNDHPTESTFPLMVCLFIPPCDWPAVVYDKALDPQLAPVINQLPGFKEYLRLQMKLQPDQVRTQEQNSSRPLRSGRPRLGLIRSPSPPRIYNNDEGSNKDSDFKVEPNERLSSLLNAAWGMWKDTIGAPEMQTVSFAVGQPEEPFSQLSPTHKRIIKLLMAWVDTTESVLNSITPGGVSVLELHHFVNRRAESPYPEDELLAVPPNKGEDEDHIDEMDEDKLLYQAIHMMDKRRGRRRREDDDTESEDEDENEDD